MNERRDLSLRSTPPCPQSAPAAKFPSLASPKFSPANDWPARPPASHKTPAAISLRHVSGTFLLISALHRDVSLRPLQKRGPIRPRRVSASVLPPCQVPIHQPHFHRRKFARRKRLLSKQFKHRPRRNGGHKTSPLIHPRPLRALPAGCAIADKRRPRRAQRDQLVRIHRQISRVHRPAIFKKIPRHPVILARPGEILHQFAKIPPMQFRPALS